LDTIPQCDGQYCALYMLTRSKNLASSGLGLVILVLYWSSEFGLVYITGLSWCLSR